MTILRKVLLFGILFIMPLSGALATDIDKQKEALNVIGDFADRLCDEVPLSGNSQNLELTGSAKAELKSLLKKIADLGIEGAAKYQKSEYENVLQKNLAALLRDSRKCKLEVFKDLKDKLLSSAKTPPIKSPQDNPNSKKLNFVKQEVAGNNNQTIGISGNSNKVDVKVNASPKIVTKTFIEGENSDAAIPISKKPNLNPFTIALELLKDNSKDPIKQIAKMKKNQYWVTSGTEVEVLEKETKPLEEINVIIPISFTKVKILSGEHEGKTGWAPTHLLRKKRVQETG